MVYLIELKSKYINEGTIGGFTIAEELENIHGADKFFGIAGEIGACSKRILETVAEEFSISAHIHGFLSNLEEFK